MEIYEWHGKSWEPYVADDVQVQFYMMSPYVLKTLSTDQKVMHVIPSRLSVFPVDFLLIPFLIFFFIFGIAGQLFYSV